MHPSLATGGGDLTVPVFSIVALCIALQGELTLAAIQAFCRTHKLASPGRAASLITQLRKKGYLVLHPEQPAGRLRRYMVAPLMLNAYRGFFGRSLAAFGLVEPEAAAFVERNAEDQIFAALMSRMLLGLINILHVQDTTPVTHFVLRNGGLRVLYHLCLAGESGGVFPPVDPVPYSVAGLARAYGLSRSHVLRMLREADDLGYIQRSADSTIRLEKPLRRRPGPLSDHKSPGQRRLRPLRLADGRRIQRDCRGFINRAFAKKCSSTSDIGRPLPTRRISGPARNAERDRGSAASFAAAP